MDNGQTFTVDIPLGDSVNAVGSIGKRGLGTLNLNSTINLRGGTTKYVFKQAMRGILPDAIIDRPKHGFAVPLGHWFRGRLGSFVRELLLSERSRRRGIFNAAYIERLVRRLELGRELDFHVWTLISFELWCRTFLDERVGVRASS